MKARWNVGDIVANSCPTCRDIVQSRYELRTVQMARSRLRVPNVLVDVCQRCGGVLAIPAQSIPQLREAGMAK
ncbi:MAG TPA: hypothetical protein VNB89_02140 [Gemmatimonadaceae bacterium]|jgi:Zn-finger nucleic acid-binding protein|nr:hypothetical protein [Gemmatimonadaceae bacterium]